MRRRLPRLLLSALAGLALGGLVGLPIALGQAGTVSNVLGPTTAVLALGYAAWRDRQRDGLERARLQAEVTKEQRSNALVLGRELLERRWAAYTTLNGHVLATDVSFATSRQGAGGVPTVRIAEVQDWLRLNGLIVSEETTRAIDRWVNATALYQQMWSAPPSPDKGEIMRDQQAAANALISAMRRDLRIRTFDELEI